MSKVIPFKFRETLTPDQRAELTLVFHCEICIANEPDRVLFRETIGCTEGEYNYLLNKYSRVLEQYRKEQDATSEDAEGQCPAPTTESNSTKPA